MAQDDTEAPAEELVEIALTEIRRSKIITVSAKIAQPEFLALERLSSACRASKSTIIREALRSYFLALAERSPALAELLGQPVLKDLGSEDGSAAILGRCLSPGPRPRQEGPAEQGT